MSVVNEWIRPANREDDEAVRLLLDTEGLHEAFKAGEFVVCEVDGRVVGCVRVARLPEGGTELSGLVVEFPYRQHGLARAMLEIALLGARHPVYALTPEEWFMGHPSFEFIPVESAPGTLQRKAATGDRHWLVARLRRQEILPAAEVKFDPEASYLDV